MIGGSGDLTPSNNTYIKSSENFQAGKYANRNIHFGVREHAMASTMNGMALYGSVIPFGGTFQTFSRLYAPGDSSRRAFAYSDDFRFHARFDRLGRRRSDASIGRTSRRLTRNSESRGHSPVRRARNPRSVASRFEKRNAPTSFAFSRQKVALIDRKKFADAKGLHKGAYILAEAEDKNGKSVEPKLILIATGSEVGLAMEAREKLNASGTPTRVVSMPCWEFFDEQSAKYKESVLPSAVKARLSIEAGVSLGWAKYVGDAGDTLAVDKFGASAPAEDVFRDYGFTVENVIKKAKKLL